MDNHIIQNLNAIKSKHKILCKSFIGIGYDPRSYLQPTEHSLNYLAYQYKRFSKNIWRYKVSRLNNIIIIIIIIIIYEYFDRKAYQYKQHLYH